MIGKILAVDPGEKRIGIAISDESCTLARGMTVIKHVSIQSDCSVIIKLACENDVKLIIVGFVVGDEGEERPQTRHARKLASSLSKLSSIRIELWNEENSTEEARTNRLAAGVKQSKRGGHIDEAAAAVILQDWINNHNENVNRHA